MYREIIALVLLLIPRVANADDLGFKKVETEEGTVQDQAPHIVHLQHLKKYSAFIRIHPIAAEYEWVDGSYQVEDEKIVFLASRDEKIFIGWGFYESSKHDHVYRSTVAVVDGKLFYAAMNEGVFHLHYGRKERNFDKPVCWIKVTQVANSVIVSWKDCNPGSRDRFTWEIPIYEATTGARHR